MKILVWNLKNISYDQVTSGKTDKFNEWGLGNNRGDCIARVVACHPCWNNINFLAPNVATGKVNPIDIFVIIEAKHAANTTGKPVSTEYQNLMQSLTTAIQGIVNANVESNANYYKKSPPVYNYVLDNQNGGPIVTTGSQNETVGIVYNTMTVGSPFPNDVFGGGLLANKNKTTSPAKPVYPSPRAPFMTLFTTLPLNPGTSVFHVVANHAPPTGKGGVLGKFKPPIDFTNNLQFCAFFGGQPPIVPLANWTRAYVMGDFNCSINSTYEIGSGSSKGVTVKSFDGLYNNPPKPPYVSTTDALSSVRNGLETGLTPPDNQAPYKSSTYLKEAYDDILYNSGVTKTPASGVLDLVGMARNMNATGKPLINSAGASWNIVNGLVKGYNFISDHLPVGIEF